MKLRCKIASVIIIVAGLHSSQVCQAQGLDGASGLYEVTSAQSVTAGSLGLNIIGRQFHDNDYREQLMSISLLMGMSPYIEVGGYISDAMNLAKPVSGLRRTAALTIKSRFNTERRIMPAIATGITFWKKLDRTEAEPARVDYGIRLLFSKTVGPLMLHLNTGLLFLSGWTASWKSDPMFGAGIELSTDSIYSVFVESAGRTEPGESSDKLISRYTFGARLWIWRGFGLQGMFQFRPDPTGDRYVAGFGLTVRSIAKPRERRRREYRAPTLTEFSSLVNLDDALKSLKKDSSEVEIAADSSVSGTKPTRLMTIPSTTEEQLSASSDTSGVGHTSVRVIYNACGRDHLARRLREKLMSLGYVVHRIANWDHFGEQNTVIHYGSDSESAAKRLANWIDEADIQLVEDTSNQDSNYLAVVIGCDLIDLIDSFGYRVIETSDGFRVVHPEEE